MKITDSYVHAVPAFLFLNPFWVFLRTSPLDFTPYAQAKLKKTRLGDSRSSVVFPTKNPVRKNGSESEKIRLIFCGNHCLYNSSLESVPVFQRGHIRSIVRIFQPAMLD